MESLQILRFWAAAAWADDELHPAEAAALERLIEASELAGDDRREAVELLAKPPALDLGEVAALDAAAREGIYRASLGIVRLDKVVNAPEQRFLATLRDALELDEATIARIEAEYRRP